MSPFLESGPVRAGIFFIGGFSIAMIGGTFIGAPRLGVRVGLFAGLALAAFGWLFVRPAEAD